MSTAPTKKAGLTVDGLLQNLPWLEPGPFRGRHFDDLARFRVAAFATFAPRHGEHAKAHQAHIIAIAQRLDDIFDGGFHNLASLAPRQARVGGNLGYEFALVHGVEAIPLDLKPRYKLSSRRNPIESGLKRFASKTMHRSSTNLEISHK